MHFISPSLLIMISPQSVDLLVMKRFREATFFGISVKDLDLGCIATKGIVSLASVPFLYETKNMSNWQPTVMFIS